MTEPRSYRLEVSSIPHRYPWVRLLATLVALALVVVPWRSGGSNDLAIAAEAPEKRSDTRPNVLIILLDDVRADELLKVMPVTEQLFKNGGTQFTNMYATTPLCCPSRTSLLTGEYAHNHGVQDNDNARPFRIRQRYSLQAYLKKAGYKTAIVGKILNSWKLKDRPRYFYKWSISRGGYKHAAYNINGHTANIGMYSSRFLAYEASRIMKVFERTDNSPWFIEVSTFAAHSPYTPEGRYRGSPVPEWDPDPSVQEEDRSDKPPWVQDDNYRLKKAAEVRKGQLRTLKSVDDLVANIYAQIDRLDERNTLAFFLSDNGFMWGEHGRLFKRAPYLPSIRLPLLVRWPDHITAGATDDRIVANIDVAPTIMEAANLEGPPSRPMDGWSLLSDHVRDRLVLEYWSEGGHNFPSWDSTLTNDYQYIRYTDDFGQVIFREYYDLVSDPYQLQNLLGDDNPLNDPLVLPLDAQLDSDRACRGTTCP